MKEFKIAYIWSFHVNAHHWESQDVRTIAGLQGSQKKWKLWIKCDVVPERAYLNFLNLLSFAWYLLIVNTSYHVFRKIVTNLDVE